MQKYMIYAKDDTDEGALARRLAVRNAHFEGIERLKARNHFVEGGALLDDADKMIGSAVLLQFEHYSELQTWLDHEPYIQGGVWKNIEIHKFGAPPPK
jgi:uncharacterized protein